VDEPHADRLRHGGWTAVPDVTASCAAIHRLETSSMDERYEIRVLGRLGPALRAAFSAMHCEVVTHQTVIRGRLSGPELHRLLERVDKSGLMIVHLYRSQP
jgi:hypothetical protein